jgi:hypothetical protein
MQNELDIVRDVSRRLDGAGIGFMLTGSMAMNYYAQPRMTRDIDVVVALQPGDSGVDCIAQKQIPFRLMEFKRRQRVHIQDFETWIVSKEDLMLSKLFWAKDSHSELQLRDVKNLVSTGCDRSYIERWTVELGLDNLWREIVND